MTYQFAIEELKVAVTAVMPILDANLSAAYTEYMDGSLSAGAYGVVRTRHENACIVLSGTLPVDPLRAYEVCAMLTIDLRTGIKDMPDQKQAKNEFNVWMDFYRRSGFTEDHKVFEFPTHPTLKSVALVAPQNTQGSPHPDIAELVTKLPHAATVTHIAPQRGKKREEGVPPFELVQNGNSEPIEITRDQFKLLLNGKFLVLSSSSGEDPNLHYHYDHYLVNRRAS
jgi:hypothetical protein